MESMANTIHIVRQCYAKDFTERTQNQIIMRV